MKNVTEITGNSEKSELDVMTFHDVIRVASENARENLYILVSLIGSVSWALGIPSLTPKPVVGIPNWLRQNIQQGAYQAGLVQVGIPMD